MKIKSRIKNEKDFWSGLLFMAVGIGFAWGAHNYSFGSAARPGPAYFPFGLGILLALLGGVILLRALVVDVEGGNRIGGIAWKPLALVVGSVVLFGVLLPWLGLFIALPLLVFTTALAGDEFHWGEAAANAVVLTAGSWFVFIWGLNLTIPLLPAFMR